MAQTKQDIIEKRVSASLKVETTDFNSSSKVVENKAFQLKKWHLKFSFLSFAQFAFFAKFSNKSCLLFLLMSGLCVINGTQCRFILAMLYTLFSYPQSDFSCL